jgi:hypothetical protein
MLSVMIKKPGNMFFMIAHRRVPKKEEVFVTIMKRWRKEKNISQKIALLTWQLTWALNF